MRVLPIIEPCTFNNLMGLAQEGNLANHIFCSDKFRQIYMYILYIAMGQR